MDRIDDFIEQHWEKYAGAFTTFPNWSIPNIFDALVNAGETCSRIDHKVDYCFWIDGEKKNDAFDFFPKRTDKDLDGWDTRLSQQLQGREYTLLLAEPHLYAPTIWSNVQQVMRPIIATTGLPAGWLDTALFIGRYSRTPFGVHKGPMSVLTLPILGRKVFKLWNETFVVENQDLLTTKAFNKVHLENSRELSATPGGALYWASRDWHIAQSDGEFTAAISIGIWNNPIDRHDLQAFTGLLERILSTHTPPTGSLHKPNEIGHDWQSYSQHLASLIQTGELNRELLSEQTRRHSVCGFKNVPAVTPAINLLPHQPFKLSKGSQIVIQHIDHETMSCAVNGYVFTITRIEGLAKAAQQLNTYSPVTPRELYRYHFNEETDAEITQSDFMDFLQALNSRGAFITA